MGITVPTLIPKPRGTSGRADFNLANAMGVETPVYHEIQADISLLSFVFLLTVHTEFCLLTREHVSH